ncbi:DUF5686 and carboxypeptidase-like regulatory domain-containing protein [Flectobacillus roseus]|uniref:DUF5686 family protein n=1 Tax=Flectobacillus roseus TaxID=502259 RepID=A0ABT6YFQ1_9BACT|nr:DUF5686 and carboxypeptidase-like regulatory domain-containing protein [Flectobacillus roseus]MDI9862395.1 DUF5686 family protein [Flectobacillus roseus]
MKRYLYSLPQEIKFLNNIFFFLLCSCAFVAQSQTIIKGKISENKTNEGIPFVNVTILGTSQGVQSDVNGNFTITVKEYGSGKVQFSSVGYKNEVKSFKKDITQTISIRLTSTTQNLSEVVVKGKKDKYRNKDNPAVALIRKVIDHKDDNRKEGLDYYQYEKYEKLQLDLSNIDDAYKNKKIFKNFQFIFDNLDTAKLTGKVSLPLYLKETVSDVYFRKSPKEEKSYIKGEKKVGLEQFLDNNGMGAYLNRMYEDVNIYDNNISLLSQQFISPISPLSPTFYRFVILDTLQHDGVKCINLGFSPRNQADFAFVGTMYVAMDSSYAVRRIKMGVPKNINLNFVMGMEIEQEYQPTAEKFLMLAKDEIMIEFNLFKTENSRGVIGKRAVSFRNYKLNNPIDNEYFKPIQKNVLTENAYVRDEGFWNQARHQQLSRVETNIYQMADSIQKVPAFKRAMKIAGLFLFGYSDFGTFEIGPVNTFYSFNPVEGFRLRLGGRTMAKLNPRLYFETYMAYGFKDERWKGFGALTYNLGKNSIYEFPNNYLRVSYQDEVRIPGQELQFIQEDNFLLSFKRGVNDKMTYNKVLRVDYRKESRSGISYEIGLKNLSQEAAGSLTFQKVGKLDGIVITDRTVTSTELSFNLRFAPNEQFYQGKNYRIPIINKYPIFQARYTLGIANILNSGYNFHNITLRANKRFFISPIGYTDVTAEGGRIFGKVPYPLLMIHRANQSYSYQLESYNLMNFLEFVSDQYAGLFVDHYFNGFFFNKIPLIKKLKFREIITFKALYGSLSDKNNPNLNPDLYKFPTNEEGQVLTHSLNNGPYMEASIGIGNILKFFRVDFVKRLSYLDNPQVSEYGIRGRFKMDF